MNYEDAVFYIENGSVSTEKPGLKRMEQLLEKLGNPHKNLKVIHIAGTNGKGSSCSMISNILIEEGYKVGLYTSPHLDKYNERFMINNVCISDEKFVYYTLKIKSICDEMTKCEYGRPTVFEILTALGFCYFNNENVDFVVLEVGLGGRFDATNVVEKPVVCGITSISFDHTAYLGNTLSEISFEKSGIIKKDCPVVLYSQSDEVYNVVKNIAFDRNAPFYYTEDIGINIKSENIEGTVFSVKNEYCDYENIKLNLLGEYQPYNCVFVLTICKALKDRGIKLSYENIIKGLENTKWNGRMEICSENPLIIIDGAHNAGGIDMLSKSIKRYFENKSITLVLGVLGDKEYKKMIELIMPVVDKVVITEPESIRKLNIEKLSETLSGYNKSVFKEKSIKKAVELAKSITEENGVIICSGSLYMVGEIRKILKL